MRIVTAREQVEMASPWHAAEAQGLRFELQSDPSRTPDGMVFPKAHAILDGKPVGSLSWYDHDETAADQARSRRGEVGMVKVHPEYQRQGIATHLFNWVKQNVEPSLRHSPVATDAGRAWSESMGFNPSKWKREPDREHYHDSKNWEV